MATSIKLKHSNTQATIPSTSDLIAGEVALNTVDRKSVSYTHLTLPTIVDV